MTTPISVNPDTMQEVGENIKASKQGNLLVLVIDTTAPSHPSSSGKMDIIASTGGFSSLSGNLRANINIGTKA